MLYIRATAIAALPILSLLNNAKNLNLNTMRPPLPSLTGTITFTHPTYTTSPSDRYLVPVLALTHNNPSLILSPLAYQYGNVTSTLNPVPLLT